MAETLHIGTKSGGTPEHVTGKVIPEWHTMTRHHGRIKRKTWHKERKYF